MLLTLPIREILPATPHARILRLDLGGHHFPYRPGQAVVVGVHGHPARRVYSLADSPEGARSTRCLELLMGVARSDVVNAGFPMRRGACLEVEGPVGHFTFPTEAPEQRIVFIAGGTGIAPLRAMLRHALLMPHRDIRVLYSARTPDAFAYEDELRGLAREGRIELRQTITRAHGADTWTGGRGRIGRAELQSLGTGPASLFFICGPYSFVVGTQWLLDGLGVRPDRIRSEEWCTPARRPVTRPCPVVHDASNSAT